MRHIILTIMGTIISGAAMAQMRHLSLQTCIDMAMKQSPTIRMANKQVERAQALQGTAWDLEKTELSLSQDPTSGGSPDNALSVTQSFDFPTVYIARRQQLKAETQAERSRLEMEQKNVEAAVASAYFQLVYQEQCLRNLRRQDSIMTRYRTVVRQRMEAGETGRRELINAERLQRENQLDIVKAENEAENARLQLMQVIGTDEPITAADELLTPIEFVLPAYNYQQTPEGRFSNDKLQAAERQVKVEKSGYAPSLSLSLRNQMVISSWNPYNEDRSRYDGGNFMGFEVGVGIPLFYGATKARVKAAKAEREQLQTQIQQEAQQRESQYNALLSRCNAARQRVEYYAENGCQWNDEMVRLATAEYEQGEIGYVEYVGILKDEIDVYQKRAEAINEYNQTVIELQRLCGSK